MVTINYAGIIYNDIAAGVGVCLSLFVQGCPLRCKNCHNPESHDPNGGKEFLNEVIYKIAEKINANGIDRPFCIMGGEPLADYNLQGVCKIISSIKLMYPEKPIYIWTGYTLEELEKRGNATLENILSMTDYLIDGPYIDSQRDITLQMRGSSNQRIWDLKNKKILDKL